MPLPKRNVIKAAIVEILQEQGTLPVPVVHEILAERFNLSAQDKAVLLTSQPQYKVEIRWARQELVVEGVLERLPASGRGYWQLSGKINSADLYADEALPDGPYKEGSVKKITVNSYERNKKARAACLAHFGYSCMACGFNFELSYGPLGKNQIHVHHIVQISSIGNEYELIPTEHLVPLCPNCHHMAHRREPPFTLQELRAMVKSAAKTV
ncbi:HNH endonuclease [Duganella sp. sic0402]|uniref:winged helix-turn-helix domain-containing protein n=1 Tax=Duganella sp. sic0402 TaxID=2854786 RepID=UPI001C469D26|nr:winged helix-turn-helix domain-containing protein [Duganella sp. sic0402]MBV7534918.1 HNH endonuclease [Duganella sp. sic0402]